MPKLTTGSPAPDFELKDQKEHSVKLHDFHGRKVLLYFYPKALTPGCTTQSCAVRDAREGLESKGVAVIGISPDLPEKQHAFDEKHDLKFPLLSDPDHMVAEAYGVWDKKSMYGKSFMGIVRSSFLIDENGIIVKTWYKVSPKDTVPNVEKEI
jgi:peroxiredoxin Q/BCP